MFLSFYCFWKNFVFYLEIDVYLKYCLEQRIIFEMWIFLKIVFIKFGKLYFGIFGRKIDLFKRLIKC